jgi:peroxiredoxin
VNRAIRGASKTTMRRKLLPITLVLGVILSLASVALADGVGSRAPEIGLSDMRGRQMRMSGLRGKVVLVNIWGTWCRPCREEMPFLDRLYQRYRDQGLVVVGVAQDSDRSAVDRYLRRARVSYPIVHDGQHAVAQRYDQVSRERAMPRSFLVDRRGIVRYIHTSSRAGDLPNMERQIQRLLR